jgi:hypothetical protein
MKPVSGAVAGLAHAIGEAATVPRAERAGRSRSPARCEVCGSRDRLMEIRLPSGRRGTFDCFECAIHALAPVCAHCGCRIIGHGISSAAHAAELGPSSAAKAPELTFCSAHCAGAGASTP